MTVRIRIDFWGTNEHCESLVMASHSAIPIALTMYRKPYIRQVNLRALRSEEAVDAPTVTITGDHDELPMGDRPVCLDVWGGDRSQDLQARHVLTEATARSVMEKELSAGYLVSLTSDIPDYVEHPKHSFDLRGGGGTC